MKEGIMISNYNTWQIWIGQEAFIVYEGMPVEIKFQSDYLNFIIGKDYDDWFVMYKESVAFNLRHPDVYKIRVAPIELMREEDVF